MEKDAILHYAGEKVAHTRTGYTKTYLPIVIRDSAISIDEAEPEGQRQEDSPQCPENDGERGFAGVLTINNIHDLAGDGDEWIAIPRHLVPVNSPLDPYTGFAPDDKYLKGE